MTFWKISGPSPKPFKERAGEAFIKSVLGDGDVGGGLEVSLIIMPCCGPNWLSYESFVGALCGNIYLSYSNKFPWDNNLLND